MAVVLTTAVGFSGCSRKPKYQVAEVSGRVLFEGQPLAGGGQILFVPVTSGEGQMLSSAGEILSDGSFRLSTHDREGVVVGEHRVEIWQNPVLKEAVRRYERSDAGEKEIEVSREERVPESKLIPAIYNGTSSPLRVTVKEQANELTIELHRDPLNSPQDDDD